ncbi:TPA: prophage tail fiber N-terminal domain-containing protein [Escherichia coli]|nr:prophage tail fiber N-terminal domain-containing protein [Escherichia coli]HBN0626336.1 prophage tail fiber N-terminal domain-containing protein [Escherichia coli]HBN0681482.1 prophage tail fiber N-terminal domain-containing protein [Escherichia coli]HBN0710712.1 prophage tail fiber N-terminal domain-containing protein [Escherichia coli]
MDWEGWEQRLMICLLFRCAVNAIGDITVYEDSQPGALNDFLLKFTEQNARPEVIIHLEELVSHARANAEAAAEYAESVKKIFDSIRTMDATTTQKGLVQLSSDTDI